MLELPFPRRRFIMFSRSSSLEKSDPDLWAAIASENRRQEDHIELIASENYASSAVLAAQGSQLTNKYAEGYPGKRYYGGCEFVDIAETLAIDRAKKLFHAEFANVQPHSGAQANQAVFFAALKPGGHLVIVDHSARSGTGIADGKTLHRIDEAVVRAEVRQAGFVLDGEGDFLRNPADARDDSSGEPKVPTDKFVLRFVRPA